MVFAGGGSCEDADQKVTRAMPSPNRAPNTLTRPERAAAAALRRPGAARRPPAGPTGTDPMNQITLGGLEAAAPAQRPTQRALAKQRTREKILASAKALFAERGYEAATIRDIAKAAGMSTGAVFASFTDKSDLFTEIAETEQTELNQ